MNANKSPIGGNDSRLDSHACRFFLSGYGYGPSGRYDCRLSVPSQVTPQLPSAACAQTGGVVGCLRE